MNNVRELAIVGLALSMAIAPSVRAQRPYIGFTYPAGGQQGTTFLIRLGGQGLDGIHEIHVSGTGVSAKLLEYFRPLSNQDVSLMGAQLRSLTPTKKKRASTPDPMMTSEMAIMTMISSTTTGKTMAAVSEKDVIKARIQKRISEHMQRPACSSIATLVFVEVTIAPDAPPGERELRLITTRGPSNPLVFHVGQVPEYTRKPMKTAARQVLGKESQALRNRPAEQAEVRVNLPCAMNGQIASREVNSYRFTARKGQRLVITMLARQLIPYIADAVPGWFQPVMALYDAQGQEVAYNDDYRFKPDPVILFEVPKDSEYVLAIQDSIYRGREDFVYRINIGELPFISNVFPLGGRINEPTTVAIRGFNLSVDKYSLNLTGVKPGLYPFTLGSKERQTNRVAFMVDTLPECFEKETNDDPSPAQYVTLPIIINGRIDKTDDWDVFQFSGRANDTVVAEVYARRLDSPLDSVLKLTDAKGTLLAFNDDCEDLTSGLDTHHADSYFMAKLPADGIYYVHIGDTARHGGDEYGYRLRISAPRPDFALRLVPSGAAIRSKEGANVSIYGIRKDGFTGPITLGLKDPPTGFTSQATSLGNQAVTRFTFKTGSTTAKQLVNLHIEGRAKVGTTEIVREAVPAEDRMQAFLWRHLVPAKEFSVLTHPPSSSSRLSPKRTPPTLPSSTATTSKTQKSKFTKGKVAGRLRQLERLYEDGLFTDEFYLAKVAECESGQ